MNTLNHLPLVGGILQGVFELIGLIVLVRFVTVNLLLQHRRAELFARIGFEERIVGASQGLNLSTIYNFSFICWLEAGAARFVV